MKLFPLVAILCAVFLITSCSSSRPFVVDREVEDPFSIPVYQNLVIPPVSSVSPLGEIQSLDEDTQAIQQSLLGGSVYNGSDVILSASDKKLLQLFKASRDLSGVVDELNADLGTIVIDEALKADLLGTN